MGRRCARARRSRPGRLPPVPPPAAAADFTRAGGRASRTGAGCPGGNPQPRAAADLYRQVQPLCEEAYRELGNPPGRFDDVVAKAIQTLLATPVVDGEIELRPKVVTYAFADRRLEALSPAQRHLLRMGPRNVRMIQRELRTLAAALGVPAGEPHS